MGVECDRQFSAGAVAVGPDVGSGVMMQALGEDLKVYLHRTPIDM
jgi:hypothetical protein